MIAYSNEVVILSTLRGDNQRDFRLDFDTQVKVAGWVTKTTVNNGMKYTIESPDGFQCKVLVQNVDDYILEHGDTYVTSGHSVVIQFMTMDEGARGYPHLLLCDGTFVNGFQIVVGICQLFISVKGQAGIRLSSMAGGIPAQPPNEGPCIAGKLPASSVTSIWWSCGGSNAFFVGTRDFRLGALCYAGSCYCLNDSVSIATDNNNTDPSLGLLQLYPLAPVDSFHTSNRVVTYSAHTPLSIDALLGWQWQIRGQLWDAFIQTASTGTIDEYNTFSDLDGVGKAFSINCISWHADYYSRLWLIHGPPPTVPSLGNIAY